MYPRVMVRDYEDTTPVDKEMASDLVRSMDSLSIEAHCSSRPTCHGSVCNSGSSKLYAKVFKSYPKTSVSPSTLRSKGKIDGIDEYNTKNVSATSVPRPRAVLSSPDNDEMIGNLNQLNRKGGIVTTPERKNHAQDASGIISKKSPLVVKGGSTPSRIRPLGQNKHAQVKVSLVDARLSARIAIEDGKKAHLVEKRSSNLMTPKLRPSTTSRMRETASVGRKNSNLVEKRDSDSATPALRSSTRSRVREINIEGCLVEKKASDLTTLKLRPSVKRL